MRAIERGDLAAEPAVVISNNADSVVLGFAKEKNIPFFHRSRKTEKSVEALDHVISQDLLQHSVDLVILSGWMLLVGPKVLHVYEGKLLNSHPALFSSPYKGKGFYGDAVHAAVLHAKEKLTGVTIHLLDAEYDHGQTLAESRVLVLNNDTVESLRNRVQAEERKLYVSVLQQIAANTPYIADKED